MHNYVYREDKYNIIEIIKYLDRNKFITRRRGFHCNYLDKFTQFFSNTTLLLV